MRNNILTIAIVFILILTSGCGSGTKSITIDVAAEQKANDGNAVVITIYQLLNGDKFRYASFESLIKNPDVTLGSDIIPNSKLERTMVPGDNIQIKEYEIKSNTVYLGIVADFHSPSKDGWQQLIPLESEFSELRVTVHESSISVAFD
jgi:type VI secretion system VasD/TssJ family lipoprotein